jgi:hypothetical protein
MNYYRRTRLCAASLAGYGLLRSSMLATTAKDKLAGTYLRPVNPRGVIAPHSEALSICASA